MGEFELIRRYFTRSSANAVLGIGDDAALVAPSAGMQLAIAADTMVEGRHFFPGTDPHSLGWKALAVNLSDMAAMGADPRWFTLCLTLPSVDERWLSGFAEGLFALADRFGVSLIGGDTTSGPLSISIQIIGEVPVGRALRRSGAQAGDDVWLSGVTGAAALAVRQRMGEVVVGDLEREFCAGKLDRPEPRVVLGQALRGIATSAIDVSDGLLADLGHIAKASGVQILLDQWAIPLPPLSVRAELLDELVLSGGDDYELVFTAPASRRTLVEDLALSAGVSLTRIGMVEAGNGVALFGRDGHIVQPHKAGFDHFLN
ncbi:thiamine-phosphate kinase [Burkholderiaceae bacterium DAT-1]|nr:thiamine-phosphate kinase [Burkholderiaceae bacterium DAT-1]